MKPDPSPTLRLQISAIVLAGGASSRMGQDKAWMKLGGTSLIQIAVEKIRSLGIREIFISGRADGDYSALGCPVLFDLNPDCGPLGGVERGLHECSNPLLLVLAVDLPHMSPDCLRMLMEKCGQTTGVVPALNSRLEPLAAIYPKRCHALALVTLAGPNRAMRKFADACLQEKAVQTLPVASGLAVNFANWNTPADTTPL